MTSLSLVDSSAFGKTLLEQYLEQGFQSLGKRDLDLLIFILLERDGALPRSSTNFEVARLLRLTPSRVRALRRDAYARWRPLVEDDRIKALERVLSSVLTEANLAAAATHAAEKTRAEGFLAIRVEHADDKEEFEQAILDSGGIPIYERNRDVLAVRFETLLTMSERMGTLDKDPAKMRRALRQLAPTADAVEQILAKNLKDLTWTDARAALNVVGISVVKGVVDAKVTALLKVVFPFL
jgi:hypothetical protein